MSKKQTSDNSSSSGEAMVDVVAKPQEKKADEILDCYTALMKLTQCCKGFLANLILKDDSKLAFIQKLKKTKWTGTVFIPSEEWYSMDAKNVLDIDTLKFHFIPGKVLTSQSILKRPVELSAERKEWFNILDTENGSHPVIVTVNEAAGSVSVCGIPVIAQDAFVIPGKLAIHIIKSPLDVASCKASAMSQSSSSSGKRSSSSRSKNESDSESEEEKQKSKSKSKNSEKRRK